MFLMVPDMFLMVPGMFLMVPDMFLLVVDVFLMVADLFLHCSIMIKQDQMCLNRIIRVQNEIVTKCPNNTRQDKNKLREHQ